MKLQTQRTAGWLLLCLAAFAWGLSIACLVVSNILVRLATPPLLAPGLIRHAARPWFNTGNWLLFIVLFSFLCGVFMLREARRRERGEPAGYWVASFNYMVASIRTKLNPRCQ